MSKDSRHFTVLRVGTLVAHQDVISEEVSLRRKRIRVEITALKVPVPVLAAQMWWFALGPPEDLQGNPVTDVLTIVPGAANAPDTMTLLRPVSRIHVQYGITYTNSGLGALQRDTFTCNGGQCYNQPQYIPASVATGGVSSSYSIYEVPSGADTYAGFIEASLSITTALDNQSDCYLYIEYY